LLSFKGSNALDLGNKAHYRTMTGNDFQKIGTAIATQIATQSDF